MNIITIPLFIFFVLLAISMGYGNFLIFKKIRNFFVWSFFIVALIIACCIDSWRLAKNPESDI